MEFIPASEIQMNAGGHSPPVPVKEDHKMVWSGVIESDQKTAGKDGVPPVCSSSPTATTKDQWSGKILEEIAELRLMMLDVCTTLTNSPLAHFPEGATMLKKLDYLCQKLGNIEIEMILLLSQA